MCLRNTLKLEGAGAMRLMTVTKIYLQILFIFISHKHQFSPYSCIEQSVSGTSSAYLSTYLDTNHFIGL